MAFTRLAFNTPPLVPDFSSCWLFFSSAQPTLSRTITITLYSNNKKSLRLKSVHVSLSTCAYIVCSNWILLSRLISPSPTTLTRSPIPVADLRPIQKNLDWPNGLWKTSGRLGKRKKGNGQWFGARRKQTRRKADKDNRALQSQGRPSNFLVFSYPFHKPVWPFFRVVPSTSHWHFVWPKSNTNGHFFFIFYSTLLLFQPQKVERCCRSIAEAFLFVQCRKKKRS